MSKFKFRFDLDFSVDQKVSSYLAFILIITLSTVMAWYTISAGKQLADDAKNMPAFNIAKRK
jgi:hypothetical protein